MKRVFIVHRWGGSANSDWYPWLKRELQLHNFQVVVPEMPEADTPEIGRWVPALAEAVSEAEGDVYFVGHSVGCQTIARYLETLPEGKKVGGVVFVAPWFVRLTNLGPEEETIAKPWLETPINWEKVKSRADRFLVIHSDNDPYVPGENIDFLNGKLGAEVIIEHNKGHFDEDSGIKELPSALEAIL